MFFVEASLFKFDIFISDYFQFGHIWSDFFQVIFEWFPGPVLEGQMTMAPLVSPLAQDAIGTTRLFYVLIL